jgi:hypothetical protein
MSYSTFRRSVVLCVLALVISASSARAAVPAWQHLAGEVGRAALGWLNTLAVGHRVVLKPVTPKGTCGINPNGKTSCPPITPKAGCGIDPQGVPHCEP